MGNVKKFAGSLIVCNLLAVAVRLVVQALFGTIFDEAFMWLVRVVGALAFLFLIYHEGWTHGAADYNLVLYDREHAHKFKGILAGIIAAIPSALLALGTIAVKADLLHTVLLFDQDIISVIYRLWNLPFDIMFDGLTALYFVPAIAMPVISGIGYLFGIKQIRLSEYFYYARNE